MAVNALETNKTEIRKLPVAAAIVALVGIVDAIYLTVHHYTGTNVQCTLVTSCETVLTSEYATIAGIPLALFGAAAYFTVFSLATLAAFGDERMWRILSLVVVLMAAFSLWLIYLQAFVINAFCQFCMLSAGTTFVLLILVAVSYFLSRRRVKLH